MKYTVMFIIALALTACANVAPTTWAVNTTAICMKHNGVQAVLIAFDKKEAYIRCYDESMFHQDNTGTVTSEGVEN